MRIQEHENTLETNVEGKTQEFGIGDASVIIEILRNRLYEHKIQTLVQEYICNARDAMREVGKLNNDFEVTVPNRLNPVFKVRDFGPGISPDRIRNVFVMYGSSTKRGTNSQTGGFGIGAKSAWSYTDSFTIVTTVDGTKRTYVAHTGVNNNGRLDLVNTEKTSEPNGTEIQVAVKSHDLGDFRNAIFRAIYFWENKPTLKGELNAPTLTSGHKIGDMIETIESNMLPEYVRFGSYNGEIMAVIDGIPYVVGGSLVNKVEKLKEAANLVKHELILHIGNGVVQVSASREKIDDSVTTVASLEKIGAEAYKAIKNHIKSAFAKVKTTSEYLATYTEMVEDYAVDEFAKFGDYQIEHHAIKSPLLKKVSLTYITCLNRRNTVVQKITRDWRSEAQRVIDVKLFDNLFFMNREENKIVQGKRIRAFFDTGQTGMFLVEPLEVIVMNPAGVDKEGKAIPATVKSKSLDMASYNQVLIDLKAKCFHNLTYVEAPKVERTKITRENTSFCLHTMERGRFKHTTLSGNTQKYFYVPLKEGSWPADMSKEMLDQLESYVEAEEDGAKICGVGERAIKMIEGNENFVPLTDWLKDFKPTKDGLIFAKYQLGQNNEEMKTICKLKDVKDPLVLEMIAEYKTFGNRKLDHVPEIIVNKMSKLPELKEFKEKDTELKKLLREEYPMVSMFDSYSTKTSLHEELAFYINAKYALNKKTKKN